MRMPSIAITFLFLMCNGGCMTAAMWADANSPTTAIQGVSATSPGGKFLLVRYQHAHERSTLEIPLDADGRPVAPFAYTGSPLTEEDILKSAGAVVRGDGPVQAAADCKDNDPNADLTIYGYAESKGLALIPYRIHDQTISLADLPHSWQKEADRQPLEADLRQNPAMFAVVPATRPRPEADRQRAHVTAAVLTPLTIPGDALFLAGVVVLYPPVWLYVQIFWPNGGC